MYKTVHILKRFIILITPLVIITSIFILFEQYAYNQYKTIFISKSSQVICTQFL